MAALMDIDKLESPEMENGGGLFAPDVGDLDMGALTSKMALVSPTNEEFEMLLEDIRTRIMDTQGETIYEVGTGEGDRPGLKDEDYQAAVATLQSISQTLDLVCVLLRERTAEEGKVAEFLLRKKLKQEEFMEVRIAVVGNVDAGKSTLLGVLTHGELDNGRGVARQKLFRHKHEMESGRTSSVGNDILGFDASGNVVNKPEHGHLDWIKICEDAAKVVTFIDLAGHERYLKTTVFGMTGHAPDFAMLMIGANAGVIGMTKEHLGLALALNVPVFVVVTKIDMCPPNVLQETLKLLTRILKSPGCRKIPVLVQNTDDVVVTATNFTSERMCPVFQVSNVSGENLDLLKMFLNLLSTRVKCDASQPAEFQIDDTFSVPGVGTVVSGTLLQGCIKLNDTLLLGPDALGQFQPVPIKSIHRKRMPVREVRGGQTASFALKKIKRASIRKGMVMVSPRLEPKACWEFEGEILVLHHPTTISVRYQAMVHVGSVRQTATIITMTEDHLRTGDKATVRFRFIKNPEYLKTDMRMVFREGRTKAVGNITKLFPQVNAVAQNTRNQRSAKKAQQENTKHSVNPQNEPQKASKRNRRAKKFDLEETEVKENGAAKSTGTGDAGVTMFSQSSVPLPPIASTSTAAAT
ncbi:GTP-binding protein 1 [Biomphalaria glabrata]|uniref:GTP-binding protein 1 n=1 Tax=Biomphalaria glabrata TaxID=6526 RepID=A0A9W2ZS10_BIOGL|nr:GTP-binding protein 1-like [Biomphalaria glabrata]XP_055877738.1 GTP-binding protein 1-like [Biomphalaria glabrata]XP_055877739.1 GTP-binding protein 1-like [Biomphalaria glabrata]XP_055877740.1 GTP-binding protein 1-like [Biomphalaria glabrata]KAI8731492.1 GTP-binding protein 1-like [Biomphalaria glabrata]